MKKIILLASAVLACLTVSVSAQNSASVAVKKNMENGSLIHRIVVSGNFRNPRDNVMLIVRNSSADITVLEQDTTGTGGSITFEFPCSTADNYTGQLNSETDNISVPIAFTVLSEGDYNTIVEKFNSATAENISSIIAENAAALSLDLTYYTDGKQSEIDTNMLGECGKLTLFTINESFDKSVLYSYLFRNEAVSKKNEILDYYDSVYYNLAKQENAKKLYESFLGFGEALQGMVYDRLAKNMPKSLPGFDSAFNEAVVLTAVTELDNTKLDDFFTNNSDLVPLQSYEKYSKALRSTYLNEIKKSGAQTIDDIVKAYDAAVKKEDSQNNSTSPSGGGGGKIIGVPIGKSAKNGAAPDVYHVKKEFSDLDGYEWARSAIKNLSERSIVKGKTEESFAPGDGITRAEFVTIIVRAFGLMNDSAECEFADVSRNHWSYKYVASGFNNGIITGIGENIFGGEEKITREQMAAILYRAVRNSVRVKNEGTVTDKLKDFDEVSDYAKTSVLALSNLKIVNGFEDGCFYPKNNATRAEVSVMVYNALEVLGNA